MKNIGGKDEGIFQNFLNFKNDALFCNFHKIRQEDYKKLFDIMYSDKVEFSNNIRSFLHLSTEIDEKHGLLDILNDNVVQRNYEKECQESILNISKYLIGEEGVKKEVYVTKEGKRGFIDFMNTKHNFYLELKRPGINITHKNNDKLSKKGERALGQTKQYKKSKIKNEEFINQKDFSKIKGVLVMGNIDNHSNKKVLLSELSKNNGDILIVSWDWLIMYFRMMLNV